MTDRELLKDVRRIVAEYARVNPTHSYGIGPTQDPFGAHAMLDRIDAALAAPVSTVSLSAAERDVMSAALSRAVRKVVPVSTGEDVQGDWVTVPREPTEVMFDAWAHGPHAAPSDTEHMTWRGDFGNFSHDYRAMIAAAPPSDDAWDAWISVDDRRPPIHDCGDDVPVWTWDGESVKEDFYLEMHEQPLGYGGWVSIGWGFLADDGCRQATHWMPRPTPEPPAMRAQGEGK